MRMVKQIGTRLRSASRIDRRRQTAVDYTKHIRMQYLIIWRYDVHPAARDAFEQAYGPNGDWAALFRASPDYLGTQLLRDVAEPDRYITIDYWRTAEAFAAFKTAWHDSYAALDDQCARLTIAETLLGNFYWQNEAAGQARPVSGHES